jgi:hypothetical protein
MRDMTCRAPIIDLFTGALRFESRGTIRGDERE